MTAIAFRDGVLAADSGEFCDGILVNTSVDKIATDAKGWVAAACGNAVEVDAFIRAFIDNYGDIPRGDWRAIVVNTEKREVRFCTEKGWSCFTGEFCALGVASAFLLGAMAAGASAERAVELAIERHAECAGRVQAVRLWGPGA